MRNHFRAGLAPGARFEELDACFDGEVDVHFVKESSQAWVTEKGPSFMRFGLHDLWGRGPTQGNINFVSRTGNRLTLEAAPYRYVVDTETGGLESVTFKSGPVARTIVQFGFGQYDVGGTKIVFPSVHASVDYYDDKLALAFLFVAKSARFNRPFDATAFTVPLPKGSKAVYYPSPDKVLYKTLTAAKVAPPYAVWVAEGVNDTRSLLPRLRAGAEQAKKPFANSAVAPGGPRNWTLLIVVNLVFVVILVLCLVFRRSRPSG